MTTSAEKEEFKKRQEFKERIKNIRKNYASAIADTDQYGNCYGIQQTRAEKGLEELLILLEELLKSD